MFIKLSVKGGASEYKESIFSYIFFLCVQNGLACMAVLQCCL